MIIATETNRADVKAQWLSQIASSYGRYCRAGWEFIFLLRDGIDALPRNDQERTDLYEQTYHLTGLSVKTQQNYVSAARKPYAHLAMDLGLEIGHLDAVLGLEDETAEDLLKLAAENSWTVARLRSEAWRYKPTPDIGKQMADAADRMLAGDDDEPPYNDNTTYNNDGPMWDEPNAYDNEDFVYVPREPLAAARKIKATFDAGDIATLVAELASIPY